MTSLANESHLGEDDEYAAMCRKYDVRDDAAGYQFHLYFATDHSVEMHGVQRGMRQQGMVSDTIGGLRHGCPAAFFEAMRPAIDQLRTVGHAIVLDRQVQRSVGLAYLMYSAVVEGNAKSTIGKSLDLMDVAWIAARLTAKSVLGVQGLDPVFSRPEHLLHIVREVESRWPASLIDTQAPYLVLPALEDEIQAEVDRLRRDRSRW